MTTSAPTQPPPEAGELDDLALYGMAEDFLDALLSAADVDTIGATNWWERAKTALETAAAASDSWRQCAAKAAQKLQIDAPDERLSHTVARLAGVLDNPAAYRRWARLAERDALSITAMVRERRTARRNSKTDKTNKMKETPAKPVTAEEPECLPF